MTKLLHRALIGLLAWWIALIPAIANQSNTWAPTTGTLSGLALVTDYNNAFSALQSSNSGGTAPANDQSLAGVYGQPWLDTSVTPNAVRIYDGSSWLIRGWIDTVNHYWIPNTAGGAQGTIASATTTDLGTVKNPVLQITGSTPITSFGSTAPVGARYFLNFGGALVLTAGAPLILPNGGSNITTVAGDSAIAEQYGAGSWAIVSYTKANGQALSASANFTGAAFFNSVISPTALVSNTNNWNPAGLSTANTIVLQCNASINITGIVAPATDGQVLTLVNTGTNPCTLTANDTNSSAGNTFSFTSPITILSGRTLTIRYLTIGWFLFDQIPARPPRGTFANLRTLNVTNARGDTAPTTANNQMKILVDTITVDDGNGNAFTLDAGYAYNCTVDVTASGAGGLDTGSVAASTWYFLWVIFNPSANVASCLASTSSTAPSMPSGYLHKARVGANQTDASSHFYRVQQYGRVAHYVNVASSNTLGPRLIQSGAAGSVGPTYQAFTVLGVTAPVTAGRILVVALNAFSGLNCASNVVAPSTAYNSGSGTPPINNEANGTQISAWLDLESTSIAVANNFGGGSNGCATYDAAWEDNL